MRSRAAPRLVSGTARSRAPRPTLAATPARREPNGADVVEILRIAAPADLYSDYLRELGPDAGSLAIAIEAMRTPPAGASELVRRQSRSCYLGLAAEALHFATRRAATTNVDLTRLLSELTFPIDVVFAFARESDFRHGDSELPRLEAEVADRRKRSDSARQAADAKHGQPGGSREKQAHVRQAWRSGAYGTKDACAADMSSKGLASFEAARDWLKGQPNPPPPWQQQRRRARRR